MLTLGEIDKYSGIFSGWNRKEVNIAYQMLLFLKKVRLTIEEFESYAEYLQSKSFFEVKADKGFRILQAKWWMETAPKCKECGAPMNVDPVNHSKCSQIPDKKIKSVWSCPRQLDCGYQEWNQKPATFYWKKYQKLFKKEFSKLTVDDFLNVDLTQGVEEKKDGNS